MSKKLIEIRSKGNKFAAVVWKVHGSCNFSCDYCHPDNYARPRTKIGPAEYSFFKKMFQEMRTNGFDVIKFFFSGGEPTLWPQLAEFCEFMHEEVKSVRMGINTNLSLPTSWWQKNYHYFDDVVASFHIAQVNKELFLKNLIFLQDKIAHLHVRLMMVESQKDELFAFAEEIKKNCFNYRIEYTPILESLSPRTAPWTYKDKEFEKFILDQPLEIKINKVVVPRYKFRGVECVYEDGQVGIYDSGEIISNKSNFFKNWECDIYNGLYINEFGGIFAGACQVLPQIGNLYEGYLKTGTGSIICPKTYCHCGADISLPKRSPEALAQLRNKNIKSL